MGFQLRQALKLFRKYSETGREQRLGSLKRRGNANTGPGGLLYSLIPVLNTAEVLHENIVPTVHFAWRHRIIVKRNIPWRSVWKLMYAITSYLISI